MWAGYVGAFGMGVVLGLLGGGGSILTVPVLVYLCHYDAQSATRDSLFVVGATALVASVGFARRGQWDPKVGVAFALPSFVGIAAARRWVLPALPETMGWGPLSVTKDGLILGVFALVMVAASVAMIRGRKQAAAGGGGSLWGLVPRGVGVGFLTGFVGAGGGFLLVPALTLVAGLPMKVAVGTSLAVIAVNSLFGFAGDLWAGAKPDWPFLGAFFAVAWVGSVLGGRWNERLPAERLRQGFGWFVLVMGTAILLQQLRS